jgi:hypothetical protein
MQRQLTMVVVLKHYRTMRAQWRTCATVELQRYAMVTC